MDALLADVHEIARMKDCHQASIIAAHRHAAEMFEQWSDYWTGDAGEGE